MKLIEREDPTCGSEFGGPDGVELENVGIARAGIEPLHVELVSLIGGIRSIAPDHANVGVLGVESGQLPVQHFRLSAKGAAGEGHDDGPAIRLPGTGAEQKSGKCNRNRPASHAGATSERSGQQASWNTA